MACPEIITCNCNQPCECEKTCNPCDPCNKENPCDSCKEDKGCDNCDEQVPDCACTEKNISTDCIVYTGDDLTCTGIKKGTLLTDVIAQLNCFICTKFDQVLKYFNIINVGSGAEVYAGVDGIGQKKLRTLTTCEEDVLTIEQTEEEIQICTDKDKLCTLILECIQNNPEIICGILENSCGPAPENIPPTVDAGIDQTIELPINSTTITAIGNDVDGTIVSYQWVKISGGNVTITNPNSDSTDLTGLVLGTYVFQVTVTDNDGATATDIVIISVVEPGDTNIPPIADAGEDQNIETTVNTTTLVGTGSTDSDGTIVTYSWTQLVGTPSTILSPNSATTSITGLVAGTYVYELTVTDNDGATATDTITIIVTTVVYYNVAISQNFTKNDCPANEIGSVETYTVPANTYTSIISQADADQQALNDILANGQNYANTNGTCTITFTCNTCTITVNVPENISFGYTRCNGASANVTVNNTTISVCCRDFPTTAAAVNKYSISIGSACN